MRLRRLGLLIALAWAGGLMQLTAVERLPKLLSEAKAGDVAAMAQVSLRYFLDQEDLPMDEAIAFDYAKEAAAKDVPLGHAMLSRCYRLGLGTSADPEKAYAEAMKAVEENCPDGWTTLGLCHLYGVGTAKNVKLATDAFRHAHEGEEEFGSAAYARALLEGAGTERNPEEAVKIYEKLIAGGSSNAAGSYATLLAAEQPVRDPAKIQGLYELALKLNPRNAGAAYGLGIFIFQTKDHETAIPYFLKAARLRNPQAAEQLVEMTRRGGELRIGDTAKCQLSKMAYEKGRRGELICLEYAYYLGIGDAGSHGGIAAEPEKAIAIAEATIRTGSDYGYQILGEIYWKGPKRDYQKAADAFTVYSPHENGIVGWVGVAIKAGGKPMAEQLPRAWAALKTSREGGWEAAAPYLEQLEQNLTPEQLDEGREWKERGFPTDPKFRREAMGRLGLVNEEE